MPRRTLLSIFAAQPSRLAWDSPTEEWENAARNDPANVSLRTYVCRRLAFEGRFQDALTHCEECLAFHAGGTPVSTTSRLRIIVTMVRLRRGMAKAQSATFGMHLNA